MSNSKLNTEQTHKLLALMNLYNWGTENNIIIELAYQLEKAIRKELQDKLNTKQFSEFRQQFENEARIEVWPDSGLCGGVFYSYQLGQAVAILDKHGIPHRSENYNDTIGYQYIVMVENTENNVRLMNEILSTVKG